MKRKHIVFPLLVLLLIGCGTSKEVNYSLIHGIKVNKITKGKVDTLKGLINYYHPNIYMGIDKAIVDSVANEIVKDNEKRLLTNADLTLELRRLTDLFQYVDPHLVFYPSLQVDDGFEGGFKNVKVLPFEIYNINDSLLVKKSYNPLLKKGDYLVSINGIDIEKFKKYIYPTWRSMDAYVMQLQAQLTFSKNYKVIVNRKGKLEEVNVEGVSFNHSDGEYYCTGKMIDDYKTGYCRISSFSGNSFIVKRLKKYIAEAKDKGYSNFIIDLRGNTGGSGYKLDEMFSLMSDKDTLSCMKSQYMKVSHKTKKDYKFLKDTKVGDLVKFPDKYTYSVFPLKKKLYQGKMNYYVLVDRSTASTAASFANIFQYNNIGKLVGEPLDHNSLNFGDVIAAYVYSNLIISTVQYNEYTKAKDGILTPDINIPYKAQDFMKDEDPILNELLERING